MSQPVPYERQFDLTNNDGQDLRTQLDIELDDVARCFLETLTNLALIQRDDGELANQSVGVEQLKGELIAGFNPPEPFQPFRNYDVADSFVTDDGRWFIVNTAFEATNTVDDNLDDVTLVYDFSFATQEAVDAAAAAELARDVAVQAKDDAQAAQTASENAAIAAAQDAQDASNDAALASQKATQASNSATAAATAEANAVAAEQAAAALLTDFNKRYLGRSSTPPTVDGNGDPVEVGALYYRDTAPVGMYVWDGSAWVANDVTALVADGSHIKVESSTGLSQELTDALDRRNIWWGSVFGLKTTRISALVNGNRAGVAGGGRAGEFIWRAGDRSVEVSGDPLEGIWIPPNEDTSGASGAWQRIDPVLTPEMFQAAGDGSDDTASLAQYFSKVKRGRGTPGAVYGYSSQVDMVVPGAVYEFNDSTFRYLGSDLGAVPTMRLHGANGARLDKLVIDIPAGITIRNVLNINSTDLEIGTVRVTSVDQQNNRQAGNDSAVSITVAGSWIGSLETDKFDNGARITADDIQVEKFNITNYVRGIWFNAPQRFRFGEIRCSGRSPNANMSPGHNGVLTTDIYDFAGRTILTEDAGEHGVRFGGNGSGSDRINVERVTSRGSGGSGVKFRCDDAATIDDVNIGTIICEDCGDPVTPISNQDGLMLERTRGIWIGHYSVKRRSKAFSCHNAVSFFDARIVHIDSVKIENTNREAFYFHSEGADDVGTTIYRDINDIYVGGGEVITPGRHVVFMQLDDADVRNVNMTLNCRAIPEAAIIIFSANAGQVVSTSVFRFRWDTAPSPSGSAIRGSGINANVVLEGIGDNFSPTDATTKAGSTFLNIVTGVRSIRNTSGSWVDIL